MEDAPMVLGGDKEANKILRAHEDLPVTEGGNLK
jgi:hypothetical protein